MDKAKGDEMDKAQVRWDKMPENAMDTFNICHCLYREYLKTMPINEAVAKIELLRTEAGLHNVGIGAMMRNFDILKGIK